MNVLIVGSGGREHALAWKLAQSPRLSHLYVAPGNAGTAEVADNVPLRAEDSRGLVAFARDRHIDLVIIGPEAPLAAGLADEMNSAGLTVFGPRRAAAQIESSKRFAKAFMTRHHIPTGRYACFSDFERASAHLREVDYRVVVKASGLAAGKGVIVPESPEEAQAALRRIMREHEFGAAGDEVVVEERLDGEEVSVLAFTDGTTVRPMPPAQDHKRLLDQDQGPNTGGMGAYAPAPVCPPHLLEEITRTVLQPAVDGLRAEALPFSGVLYAGLMLTAQGPRVLEFNCRFGDPETQALLPLLDSDLLDIALACAWGHLADADITFRKGAAACIVLASAGYPGKYATGCEIQGLGSFSSSAAAEQGVVVLHAGTQIKDHKVVSAGGRVLGVTGWDASLPAALERAYQAIEHIHFEGMQYRRDIGQRATRSAASEGSPPPRASSAYTAAGVDIDAGNRAVALMRDAVRATYGPEVLAGIGAFGGLFDAAALKELRDPVLVASTDGVGTKVKLAAQAGRYDGLGYDIVNHCVNDILVQGARPLFFLDYVASSKLDPERVAAIVKSMAAACRAVGCALLGGETAEMPGVYAGDEFDIVGTLVGIVDKGGLLPRPGLAAGDRLIGLRSSGPHTNGYSLIRKALNVPLDAVLPELGRPLAEVLLAPHRSYLKLLQPVLNRPGLKALAHVTGGGFVENIPRVLPDRLSANIRLGSWPVPPLFRLIQQRGEIAAEEMYRVFNMGIGMVAIVAPEASQAFQASLGEDTFVIGELVQGERQVVLT